jgi:hypothetical protein
MSTRYDKNVHDASTISMGYEGTAPDDFSLPSCDIEDVDRAVFNLFNKDIPFFSDKSGKTTKTPVIFATGERFAILRRNKPLRDKAGALIIPLISIMRTAISQESVHATNQVQDHVIKVKLSKKDPRYQNLVNKAGLKNQDNVASDGHKLTIGTNPGQVATRYPSARATVDSRTGLLLADDLGNNIFEIITMPPTKAFKTTYEITFWTQYIQEMNSFMNSLMNSYYFKNTRALRIETDKGYWFVGHVSEDLSQGANHDEFTDDERIIRYTFTFEVNGYTVETDEAGAQSSLRSHLSAPRLSFDIDEVSTTVVQAKVSGAPSGNPGAYVLSDLSAVGDNTPGDAVGHTGGAVSLQDSLRNGDITTSVGGSRSGEDRFGLHKITVDPFTGEEKHDVIKIKTRNRRQGETVFRAGLITNLDAINE